LVCHQALITELSKAVDRERPLVVAFSLKATGAIVTLSTRCEHRLAVARLAQLRIKLSDMPGSIKNTVRPAD
jgi:hypothetical protein